MKDLLRRERLVQLLELLELRHPCSLSRDVSSLSSLPCANVLLSKPFPQVNMYSDDDEAIYTMKLTLSGGHVG